MKAHGAELADGWTSPVVPSDPTFGRKAHDERLARTERFTYDRRFGSWLSNIEPE